MTVDVDDKTRAERRKLGLTILIATILSLLFPVFAPGAGVGLVLGGGYIYFSSSREEVRSLAGIAVLVGAVFLVLILYFFVGMSVVSSETVTSTETVSPGVEAHTVSVYGKNRLGQEQWGYFKKVVYDTETGEVSGVNAWHEVYGLGWNFDGTIRSDKVPVGSYLHTFSQGEFVLSAPQSVEYQYPWIEQRIYSGGRVETEAGGIIQE